MCTQTDRGRGRARDIECIVAGDCRQIAEPLLTSALRFPAFLCARGAPILPREISHGLAEQMARDAILRVIGKPNLGLTRICEAIHLV